MTHTNDVAELQRRLDGITGAMDELRAQLHGLSREYAEVMLRKMNIEALAGRVAA